MATFSLPSTQPRATHVTSTMYAALGSWRRPPTAQVERDAVQSMDNGVWELVAFDVENWDSNTMWSSTANNKVFARTAGKYLVTFHGGFANSTLGTIRAWGLSKTSTAGSPNLISAGIAWDIVSGITHMMPTLTMVNLSTSDYMAALMFQNSGAGLNTSTGAGNKPTLSMLWFST